MVERKEGVGEEAAEREAGGQVMAGKERAQTVVATVVVETVVTVLDLVVVGTVVVVGKVVVVDAQATVWVEEASELEEMVRVGAGTVGAVAGVGKAEAG